MAGLIPVYCYIFLANLRHSVGFHLTAHHVHHGLSIHADSWADFCQSICNQLNIPLTISSVNIKPESKLGIEAAARKARYSALMSQNAGFICTAHHQDDQAETLLLQMARGAGVKGLAAMAPMDLKKKITASFTEYFQSGFRKIRQVTSAYLGG